MIFSKSFRKTARRGFTLVELIITLAIVGLLVGLALPEFSRFQDRARSTACLANLRTIGVSVRNYVNDNDATFPIIETNPASPIYPEELGARGILETLQPYGLVENALRCPADVKARNYFASRGTSYEWRPVVDDEPALNPVIYTRRGERQVNPSRVRLVIDIDAVHNGRQNQLYGDGRVRGF
jgi:prepilin-type N-terminal cleavage/methylation domain-containing protein